MANTTDTLQIQGELLMRWINSDVVEIYSIIPKHKTICILKSFDCNGNQSMTYWELKAAAEQIVMSVNRHTALIAGLKALKIYVNASSKEYPTSASSALALIDTLLKNSEQQ